MLWCPVRRGTSSTMDQQLMRMAYPVLAKVDPFDSVIVAEGTMSDIKVMCGITLNGGRYETQMREILFSSKNPISSWNTLFIYFSHYYCSCFSESMFMLTAIQSYLRQHLTCSGIILWTRKLPLLLGCWSVSEWTPPWWCLTLHPLLKNGWNGNQGQLELNNLSMIFLSTDFCLFRFNT